MQRADSLEKTLMLGKIEGRKRRGDRGRDGWIVSLTQWTWVWANSWRWWRTGRPGVPQSMGSQRVRQDWANEQQRSCKERLKLLFPSCCYLVAKSCPTLCDPMDCDPIRLLCPWDSPGKNTRVGCHFLPQGIFPAQGSNPHLLHWQADSLPMSHQGSPIPKFIHWDMFPWTNQELGLLTGIADHYFSIFLWNTS